MSWLTQYLLGAKCHSIAASLGRLHSDSISTKTRCSCGIMSLQASGAGSFIQSMKISSIRININMEILYINKIYHLAPFKGWANHLRKWIVKHWSRTFKDCVAVCLWSRFNVNCFTWTVYDYVFRSREIATDLLRNHIYTCKKTTRFYLGWF